MPPNSPHIFLIGFNKCGTTSFHDYFKANGISSVHWRANTLALSMKENSEKGRPLLEGLDHWTAYTDMICIPDSPWGQSNTGDAPVIEGGRYFRELHRDYPDALFILNTRDPTQWIRSRLKHDGGQFAKAYRKALSTDGIQTRRQLKRRWLEDWYQHHAEVMGYFKKHGQKQFLFFHISETPVKQLNLFLDPYFSIEQRNFPHHHKSV